MEWALKRLFMRMVVWMAAKLINAYIIKAWV